MLTNYIAGFLLLAVAILLSKLRSKRCKEAEALRKPAPVPQKPRFPDIEMMSADEEGDEDADPGPLSAAQAR